MRNTVLVLVSIFALLGGFAHSAAAAEEYWLFAGQSNMSPGGQSRAAFGELQKNDPGTKRKMVSSQHDGKPISFWLPENRGGELLAAAFKKIGENTLHAFVWQQAESNQSLWFLYEAELAELVGRIRATAKNPELPIYINQLGPRYQKVGNLEKVGMGKTKHNKNTQTYVTYWNMAFMRELQRRFAMADPNVHIINTADLTIRDKGVHFDGASHKEIGRRVGLVAASKGQSGGPIPVSVSLDPADSKTVVLTCDRVTGSLQLVEGWQQNAAISPKPAQALPATFADWPVAPDDNPTLPLPPQDLLFPVAAAVRSPTTVAFTFDQAITPDALFHWCFDIGANEEDVTDGPQPSLLGLTDDTGITAVSASLLPLAAP